MTVVAGSTLARTAHVPNVLRAAQRQPPRACNRAIGDAPRAALPRGQRAQRAPRRVAPRQRELTVPPRKRLQPHQASRAIEQRSCSRQMHGEFASKDRPSRLIGALIGALIGTELTNRSRWQRATTNQETRLRLAVEEVRVARASRD